jgi:NAD(P)-dependent dehydrogenase (short-subunit alcohol dehydrogenase family)
MNRIEELFSVRGLSVIVTGGASGIGRGYAEAMAANGADLALFDMDEAGLRRTAEELGTYGGKVETFIVDATDRAALDAATAVVAERFGRIDVVFANVGISGGPGFVTIDGERPAERAFENLDPALLDKVLQVNIGATFRTIQSCVPHMKRNGGGRIIVTSSISATRTEILVGAAYVASKGGVGMLVKLAADNILVNAISPGPVVTNIGGGRLKDPAARAPFDKLTPIGRVAFPEDLYGAALYLASPASAYVTGAEIIVDGGAILGPDSPGLHTATTTGGNQ